MPDDADQLLVEDGEYEVIEPASERHCAFLKDNGERCKAYRVRGERLCAGHLGLGVAAGGDIARAAQREGAARRSELVAERKRTPQEAMRAVLAERAEDFARVRVEIALDPKTSASDRLAAIRDLESRVLGKPTERVEHSVEVPGSIQRLREMSAEERDALWRQLEDEGVVAELEAELPMLALPPG